jgi:hypothetical protein
MVISVSGKTTRCNVQGDGNLGRLVIQFRNCCNVRNIPFVNHVKYLGVVFDKRITWRMHIEMIEAKVFRTSIRIYSLFKSERLSSNMELTLHKTLIKSVISYACPAWKLVTDTYLKIAALAKQGSP